MGRYVGCLIKLYASVSIVLVNADLTSVSKLRSTFNKNAVSEKHISNTTTLTPFSKNVRLICNNSVLEDKPVCRLLRNTSSKFDFFFPVKMDTFDHVLCKSFLSHDLMSIVAPVYVVNVSVKFMPLFTCLHS